MDKKNNNNDRIIDLHITNTFSNLIQYLKRTKDEDWTVDVVRTKDQKNCLFGHIFNWGGNLGWEWFESVIASTYMVYPVNDKEHPKYQQETAKDRCIAYLMDIQIGNEMCIKDIHDEYDRERIATMQQ
jgi:hypothetical protein